MIIDGQKLDQNLTIESHICIIGAGAAGITLALELASTRKKITLIESGGLTPDREAQSLALGKSLGTVLPPNNHYLYSSRLRYWGGGTNHWAGYLRPMDEIDFQKRNWIPGSGWPFSLNEIAQDYEKAGSYLGIHSFVYSQKLLGDIMKKTILKESDLFATRYFHIAEKSRLRKHYLGRFKRSKSIDVILNTTALEVFAHKENTRIEKIRAMNLLRKEIFFKAEYFILAAGGVENPRLLLLSHRRQKKGLGNQNDLVGRFFMEHPHLPAGRLFVHRNIQSLRYYRKHKNKNFPHFISGTLCPTEKTMRENHLLNLNIQLVRHFMRIKEGKIINYSDDLKKSEYPLLRKPYKNIAYAYLKVRAEQSPNKESRIILSDKKDRFHCPQAKLYWRLKAEDLISIKKNMELLGRELGKYGLGRVQIDLHGQEEWPQLTYGGSHHMGTTRMNNSPNEGVVDSQLKLHGYQNLFVLGSSVFPTGGGVNPTFTIMALAVRLAKHLRNKRD